VAVGGADQNIRLYNLADAKLLHTIKGPGAIKPLAFSPNNLNLTAACADGSVQVWNVAWTPGQPLPPEFGSPGLTHKHEGAANDVVIAADNATFYSTGADKTVKMWRLASDNPTRSLSHPNIVDCLAFSKDG